MTITAPPAQVVLPLVSQPPLPQVVGVDTKSSSVWPSQSSSIASQVSSFAAPAPGAQESVTCPFVQEVVPLASQAPVPQPVLIAA